jgi:hypothetical protein
MTIDENDVRAVLRRATDHLTGPPGLLDEVRRGGRRRMVRRRAVLIAAVAVAASAPVGGALRYSRRGYPTEVASPIFDQPTRGDLAGDEAYLREVRAVWRHQLTEDRSGIGMRGDPHVVWAGRTPAGPAAYVTQRHANPVVDESGPLIGEGAFVEPTADGPVLTTIESITEADFGRISPAVLLGPDRDVLLVLDTGTPVQLSPDLRYTADGKIKRTFRPVAFRDGAAVLRVPAQRTKITIALSRTPISLENSVNITNAQQVLFPNGNSPRPPEHVHILPGAQQVWGDPAKHETPSAPGADPLADYVDTVGYHTNDGSPLLSIYGITPDGRRLMLQTIQYDDDPARVIAMLARGNGPFTVAASAFADWKAPLPVRLRLPNGQGVLVAAERATLSYRVGAEKWRDAGRDAALLPATATHIRVTAPGGSTTVTAAP